MDLEVLKEILEHYLLTNGEVIEVHQRLKVQRQLEILQRSTAWLLKVTTDRESLEEIVWREMYHRYSVMKAFKSEVTLEEMIRSYKDDGINLDILIVQTAFNFVRDLYDDNESDGYNLKVKLRRAFLDKLKESEDYIDSMLSEIEGSTIEDVGLDPEHNVNEIIKDLKNL